MRYKGVGGYLTLEAAFLVPMAIFLFVFVIHFSFMMSGRTYLAQDAYSLAFRASMTREEEDAAGFANSVLSAQTRHRYFGNTLPEAETGTDGKHVIVKLRMKTTRRAFDLAPDTEWEHEHAARAIRIDITKRIRTIDRIADLAKLALQRNDAGN